MLAYLIYEDTYVAGKRNGGGIPLDQLDANVYYLQHYANSLELSFFLANGNREEKQRASIEMEKCEKKMAFWRQASNFDQAYCLREIEKLKRKWR